MSKMCDGCGVAMRMWIDDGDFEDNGDLTFHLRFAIQDENVGIFQSERLTDMVAGFLKDATWHEHSAGCDAVGGLRSCADELRRAADRIELRARRLEILREHSERLWEKWVRRQTGGSV